MRTNNPTLLALAAVALWATSCSNDNEPQAEVASKYITVSTHIGAMTRVATDGDGSQRFEADDQISVYAWTGTTANVDMGSLVVDNSVNTYDGSSWSANPQMLWLDPGTPHYFIGVYPSRDISDLTSEDFSIDPADQTASDLLVANNYDGLSSLTAPGGLVDLEFNHMMARFVVNLTFRNQWGGTPDVESVVCHATTAATVNYLTATTTARSVDGSTVTLPVTTVNRQYVSIMVPQSDFRKVVLTIDGKAYTYTNDDAAGIPLVQGKITTLNLIVGRDEIVLGNVSINDWQQGATIEDGEAQAD